MNLLQEIVPDLRVSVRANIPRAAIQARLERTFDLFPAPSDPGACVGAGYRVDWLRTIRAHADVRSRYAELLTASMDELARLDPELLLTNIGYVGLDAVANLGIPTLAFGSLNWADVPEEACPGDPSVAQLCMGMRTSYSRATKFIGLTPGMPSRGVGGVPTSGPACTTAPGVRLRLA